MKGYNGWSYAPYIPADRLHRPAVPYICRLAPGEHAVEIEWRYPGGEGDCTLWYTLRGEENWIRQPGRGPLLRIDGLRRDQDYQLYLELPDGTRSMTRLFRTGEIPGTVVNYLHPEDTQYAFSGSYLCSPSILKLQSGALLASMDLFRGHAPQNLMLLFRSEDGGRSWRYLTDIFPCFWGKLFEHQGKLFMLGVSNEYGDLLIGCSQDEGKSWGTPTPILRGSASTDENGNHRAPMVILRSHGRLWTGSEYGSWHNREISPALFSIDENADPMVAENWSYTGFLHVDETWPGAVAGNRAAIEGNAVETPDGRVVDFLRYAENRALVLSADVNNPDAPLQFERFAEFPLAHTKFEIRRREDGLYVAVGNPPPARTVLSVYTSRDLQRWEKHCDVVDRSGCDVKEVGFQYPAFCFDGEDILILSRTAYNRAHNFHDSNFMTLHRVHLG